MQRKNGGFNDGERLCVSNHLQPIADLTLDNWPHFHEMLEVPDDVKEINNKFLIHKE